MLPTFAVLLSLAAEGDLTCFVVTHEIENRNVDESHSLRLSLNDDGELLGEKNIILTDELLSQLFNLPEFQRRRTITLTVRNPEMTSLKSLNNCLKRIKTASAFPLRVVVISR
jgi:hypothetical protein